MYGMPRDMPSMPNVASDAPVGSSPWWIDRLSKVLDNRAAPMRKYEEYYRGKHPMLYAGSKYRAAFGNLFSGFADNFCGLVVDAVEQRLDIVGCLFLGSGLLLGQRSHGEEEADEDGDGRHEP